MTPPGSFRRNDQLNWKRALTRVLTENGVDCTVMAISRGYLHVHMSSSLSSMSSCYACIQANQTTYFSPLFANKYFIYGHKRKRDSRECSSVFKEQRASAQPEATWCTHSLSHIIVSVGEHVEEEASHR